MEGLHAKHPNLQERIKLKETSFGCSGSSVKTRCVFFTCMHAYMHTVISVAKSIAEVSGG
jgi:hypothetical protein